MDKKIERSGLQKHLKTGVAVGLILATALAYAFTQPGSTGRSQTVALNSLTISTVQQGQFIDALSLRGQVVPKTTIYLDTVAGGRVEERLVEQGEYVEQGQPLVRLSNTNLQLDVMSREAQVTEQLNFLRNTQMNMETSRLNLRRDLLEIELQINHLKRRYTQSVKLAEKGVLAQDTLDEIKDDLAYYQARKELTLDRQKQENTIREVQVAQLEDSAEMLQKNLKFARHNLDNLLIKAPVSGYLSELDVEIGESKERGARLGQIDIPDEYKLTVRLDEFYLNQVHSGMAVQVSLGSEQVNARVSKIDSRVTNAQFQVEVALPAGLAGIKRGQNLDVALMLGDSNNNALLINRGAFYTSSGGNWVYVLAGDRAVRKDIVLGKKNRDYFEILEGLAPGDQVITSSYSQFDKAQTLQLN
ncbi:HlyD family efflux transporter periplasmic adaptor subunit [Pseudoalteromonas sp. OOF1S-7]|uniref:efflux RND transporter periplasmic adaptor subunit n=1 Tax=Pseudoalteromonas sp. OOF1S-7 TaxID=2917757 RepID=UPI001EF6B0ED|nr:HlyD family efflux transporter periplasmic adaptor subunit [Pseudoalteromonas sp. OOF1S-7]MCG7534386.1 HlyD family efflux transporter periplasmic adaptor subunit [Pseudoalteromonas sp. OOF1S-7]